MLAFLLWYLTTTAAGLLAFPLVYRLFPALPDRGYTLARTFALLIWGYVFWLLASIGGFRNDIGGALLSLAIVVAGSFYVVRQGSLREIIAWLRSRRSLVTGIELLFLVTFAGWALVRAANPEINGTEKPMELAFINAILRSPVFPPHDPWLSGYAISYYYFGYVLVAMLANITSVPGNIAFNLGISLVFALSASGAYGIIYNLLTVLATRNRRQPAPAGRWSFAALLAPLFLLIVSNLEGFLEVLHARGLFWRLNQAGQLSSSLWRWLDLQELSLPPAQPFTWMPTRYLWWWRASRVVQDYDFAGMWREVIDEFPFFSYLLSDLHPHVLAMPFALLAIGLILNLFLGGGRGQVRFFALKLELNPPTFLISAIVLGGLAFLNTWDFPVYVALFAAAYFIRRLIVELQVGEEEARLPVGGLVKEFLLLGLSLGLSGVLLYLPFYLGFSSQAGGFLPSLVYTTRGAHFWVMFGPLLFPILAFLVFLSPRGGARRLRNGFLLATGLLVALFSLAMLLGLLIANLPVLGDLFLADLGASERPEALLQEAFSRRILEPGGWLTLLILLGLAIGLLWPRLKPWSEGNLGESGEVSIPAGGEFSPDPYSYPYTHLFALLLILLGALVAAFPEFFYLRDQFGSRMNTIFKFYYQAWVFWSLAAAYGTVVIWLVMRGIWRSLLRVALILVLGTSLVYPVLALWTKTSGFSPPQGFTLNGTAYLERQAPEDMAAIAWLRDAPSGVVAEAVGGSYSSFARVATHSGQQNVLGWPGHQSQWRGGAKEIGSRQSDVEIIFRSNDWEEVETLIRKYDIRYIYVGPLERSTYRVSEAKFIRNLPPVFELGQVTIYEVP